MRKTLTITDEQCNDIIECKNINNLKLCSCDSSAVDGGLEYIKRIGNLDEVIKMSKFN